MNTKDNLYAKLQTLLRREQEALNMYLYIHKNVQDDILRNRLEDIYKEEIKHIEYVKELMSYCE